MIEATEQASFGHMTKKRMEASASQIWRKTAKKIRLSMPMGQPMATAKEASPILWNEKGRQSHRGRRGESCVWDFDCVSLYMGDGLRRECLCNIRVTRLGIFWEDGVCVHFIYAV
jgi:hypothetical protein